MPRTAARAGIMTPRRLVARRPSEVTVSPLRTPRSAQHDAGLARVPLVITVALFVVVGVGSAFAFTGPSSTQAALRASAGVSAAPTPSAPPVVVAVNSTSRSSVAWSRPITLSVTDGTAGGHAESDRMDEHRPAGAVLDLPADGYGGGQPRHQQVSGEDGHDEPAGQDPSRDAVS